MPGRHSAVADGASLAALLAHSPRGRVWAALSDNVCGVASRPPGEVIQNVKRLIAVLLVAMIFVAGCGKSSSSSNGASGGGSTAAQSTSSTPQSASSASGADKTHFAKTKFVLHAGLAFGAFHRYIYKPFKAAFAIHETRVALNDARSSAVLSKVLSPLLALQTKLTSLRGGLRSGRADPAAIQSANSDAASAGAASKSAGQPVTDQPTPSLGG